VISNINNHIINNKIKLISIYNKKHKFLVEIVNLSKESDKNKTYNAKLLEIDDIKIETKINLELILQ